MTTPLTNTQKGDICRAAKAAWKVWPEREDYCGGLNADVPRHRLFDAWRREEQERACGLRSLTTATQAHFAPIMAHFSALATPGEATALTGYWLGRAAEEERNRVLHLLRTSTLERKLAYPGYPEAICRKQYRCGLGGATEKQLWRLLYTVRSRRKAGGGKC